MQSHVKILIKQSSYLSRSAFQYLLNLAFPMHVPYYIYTCIFYYLEREQCILNYHCTSRILQPFSVYQTETRSYR